MREGKIYAISKYLLGIYIVLFGGLFYSSAQCPTVNDPVQTFCDIESVLVSDLVAQDNGSGVVWYDTPTSTTPLASTEGLVNGEDYYADDNSGSCGSRQQVTVVIYGAPIGFNFQGVCVETPDDATIADLIAIGNDVQWYLSFSGGTPLPDTTLLSDNTIYYADQANPDTGCRTSRLSVLVNVGLVPIPTGDAVQEFCIESDPTVADLNATGTNNWYATAFSFLPLDPTTPLIDGENYYATTIDPPCESLGRFEVTVVITQANEAGTDGLLELCEGALATTPSINLFDYLEGTPSNNGTWAGPFPTSNGSTGTIDTINFTVANSPYEFTYSVDETANCPTATATVTITITENSNAGINGTVDLCSNGNTVDLFNSLGGTPDTGGTWSPALASGTGIFDPTLDSAGVYTYTVPGIPPCGDAVATVDVSIIPEPNAGNDSTLDICSNDAPQNLFDSLGGTPDIGGTWSPALASGSDLFDPLIDTAGTYTYTVAGIAPCQSVSATLIVTIISAPNGGINANLELCEEDTNTYNLFDTLEGTPDLGGSWSPALASGSGIFDPAIDPAGTYTYTVTGTAPCADSSATVTVTLIPNVNAGTDGTLQICTSDTSTYNLFDSLGGTPDAGGTWTPALTSGSGIFDPSVDTEGTYTYTVLGTAPCGDASATVTVSIIEEPNAGTDGTLEVCENDTPQDLFNSLEGTPNLGGSWFPALASGSGIFDPAIDPAGTYTYTVIGTAPCADSSATVTVTIIPNVNAGTDGTLQICTSDTSTYNLFDSLGGTPDTGGTWTPALTSGSGIFDPSVDTEGTYTYTVIGTAPCGDASATVTVSIIEEPNAGTDGTLEVCENDIPQDLFNSLEGTPDLGGSWSPALASGSGIFDPALDSAGTYTYTVTGTAPCADSSATVTVTIVPNADAGTDGTLQICTSDTSTYNLFDSLGGTPDAGGTWTPALTSGSGIFDPSVDTEGTYTYTVLGTAPCGDASATVTVSIIEEPNAGTDGTLEVCENDTPQDLFNSLEGTPNLGGSWSPALASGSGIFDPALDPAGTYTYTVTGTAPCADSSATVTVTIIPNVNAGTDGTLQICTSDTSTYNLFDSLGGTPDAGGTWTPALTSGSGIFDPSVDTEGTYTYTVTGTAPCGDASATVTVSIIEEPNAGTDGTLEVCENDTPQDLSNSLEGSPDLGGSWSPALASGSGIFDPAIDPSGTYTYTVTGTAPCVDSSATVTVTIIPNVNAGTDGTLQICTSDTSTYNLFDSLSNTPDTNGTWTPALTSGSGIFDPSVDTEGTYTYTVTGTAPCGDASATVTVSIIEEPNAGTDGTLEVCENDTATYDLFDSLGDTPNMGGTWSPSLASGTGIFDPATDATGDYTYTVINPGCNTEATATVSVTVVDSPVISDARIQVGMVCLGYSNDVTITLALQVEDGFYDLSYELSGANTISNSASTEFIGGDAVFTIPAEELQNTGETTITITGISSPDISCSEQGSLLVATFTVLDNPTPELSDNGDLFCGEFEPTIAELSANIIDSNIIIWYDAPIDGNVLDETQLLEDGGTYYGAMISDDGCESVIRLDVTVTLDQCFIIPDGFSPNDDGINDTFTIPNLRDLYPDFTLEIYNRYGNVLYKGDTNKPDWNGESHKGVTLGNGICPVGVYFYILNFNDGERKPIQGRVYLSR
ncbi:gliding motility-associated C-terminal domain-containing protein [Mangrovimonas sp. YM274]|uniref:gliding motility-associated C-terminal domain-containing protein n=1 Tax=Mangrovimonas sp. YM274 TaxID=3070660 RepID=UPI0027DDA49A|nr:gliding motility-associated C-terminal domain-containing protein [Mangrovimonas sp. YM274]WMI67347.1 gliding motility-associated C-terminal domain-containing protein [Mangrovimonas sp. YM274]